MNSTWTRNLDRPAGAHEGGARASVPLSDRALAIVAEMDAARTGDYVFPGQRPGRPLSGMAFEMLLRRSGRPTQRTASVALSGIGQVTRRIFRASLPNTRLRTSSATRPNRLIRRSDALARRRELMDAWA